jgi:hypothetical protein
VAAVVEVKLLEELHILEGLVVENQEAVVGNQEVVRNDRRLFFLTNIHDLI